VRIHGQALAQGFAFYTANRLTTPQISVIRAVPCNSCHERNVHAHKAKRHDEKGNSKAEIKVGWPESSKKEAESRR
jgi:hypothetical protein